MKPNPYKYKGALDPKEDHMVLIPRKSELQTVMDGLKKGDYWTITGPRQIGKSTFLRIVQDELNKGGYLPIFIDFQIFPKAKSEFYPYLIDCIYEKITPKRKFSDTTSSTLDALGFIQFLESFIRQMDRDIVFLFDEIGGLKDIDDGERLREFLSIWRQVYNSPNKRAGLRKYSVIIAAAFDLIGFTSMAQDVSPFDVAEVLHLKDFSRTECDKIVRKPLSDLNIKIRPDAKDKLIAETGGHPQILQHICYEVVELGREESRTVTVKDIIAIIKKILFKNNTVSTLQADIDKDKELAQLVVNILNGKKERFEKYKKYAISYSGPIVDDGNLFCAIRNKIFEAYLWTILEIEGIVTEAAPICFIDEENKNEMPYALRQLKIRNFSGVHEAYIGDRDLPVDTQWIFLTGENAFGKSAVLRAIALAMFGSEEANKKLVNLDETPDLKIGAEFLVNNDSCFNTIGGKFDQIFNFAAYGPYRLELQHPESQNSKVMRSGQTYSLFNSDGLVLNIEYEMFKLYYSKKSQFEIVKSLFLKLIPSLADIKIVDDKVLYVEKEVREMGASYENETSFQTLASGPRSIIAMVGDMLIRLLKCQPKVPRLKELAGIVLIDELDLHLHPSWLRKLPGLLSKLFPKVQFIASTHSGFPFLGAPKRSVFLRVYRSVKDGITIKKSELDIEIKYLRMDTILTSPIFGMDGDEILHIDINDDELANVRTENSFSDIEETRHIQEKLKKHEEGRKMYSDELLRKWEAEIT